LDLDHIGVQAENNMPRISKQVEDFTVIGKTCLERAHLEAERWYCGNKTEERLDASASRIELIDREKIATLLDPLTRTLVKKPDQLTYVVLLKELYVAYAASPGARRLRRPVRR
jgi:hypothetical protein